MNNYILLIIKNIMVCALEWVLSDSIDPRNKKSPIKSYIPV